MATPTTTLFPASLPTCCGPLYDVNGGCVPPAATATDPAVWNSCFCNDARVTGLSTGNAAVCPACAADAVSTIQGWFTSFCAGAAENGGNENTATTSSTSTSAAKPGAIKGSTGSGSWIDNHYQWVIFLVIMVVAIIGIWVGACVWRRRYIRKRDQQYALGTNRAHATESGRVLPNASNGDSIHVPASGMFEPAPLSSAGVYVEKPQRKKWLGSGRT